MTATAQTLGPLPEWNLADLYATLSVVPLGISAAEPATSSSFICFR